MFNHQTVYTLQKVNLLMAYLLTLSVMLKSRTSAGVWINLNQCYKTKPLLQHHHKLETHSLRPLDSATHVHACLHMLTEKERETNKKKEHSTLNLKSAASVIQVRPCQSIEILVCIPIQMFYTMSALKKSVKGPGVLCYYEEVFHIDYYSCFTHICIVFCFRD